MDTSAWVAFVDRKDAHHEAAVQEMGRSQKGEALVTSEYVFDETVTRLRMTVGHGPAVKFGLALRASTVARVVPVEPRDVAKAWEAFVRHSDKDLSFTDCTSLALVERLGAGAVFTFDEDFARLGVTTRPARGRRRC